MRRNAKHDEALLHREGGREMRQARLMVAGVAVFAGASLLASSARGVTPMVRVEGPPLALAPSLGAGRPSGATEGARRPDRAQLIAMAERDVGGLVRRIIAEEHSGLQRARARAHGKSGLRFPARAPQLAGVPADDLVVGGRHYVKSQMLSAIDDFFDGDENKVTRFAAHLDHVGLG